MRVTRLTKADGEVVCERCQLAVNPFTRFLGLQGRASLPPGNGMLFRPTSSVHMFFMRFSIDVVFCDGDLVVLEVVRGLRPWRVASKRGARVAIELPEGAASGIQPGDRLVLATIEA